VRHTFHAHGIVRRTQSLVSQYFVVAAGSVFAIYVVGTVITAALKPMWFDELVTYYIAGQPDLRHLWSLMTTGIEQTPPVYHLLVYGANRLLGPGELATRLPSIIGMTVAVAGTFLFLRPRVSVAAAAFGAAVPVLAASGAYAYEGRAYGLLLGLTAVAAVCWQRLNEADSSRPIVLAGFAASLWLAVATHYYAGLLLVPFAVGQFVAERNRGSRNGAIWIVLVLAPLVLLPWLPLAKAGFAQRLWSPPRVSQVAEYYGNMLAPAAFPIMAALVALGSLSLVETSEGNERQPHLRAYELAFAGTLAVLPVVGWTIASLVTGVWTDRYGIAAVLGLAMLIAAALHRSGTLIVQVVSIVALGTVLLREVRPLGLLIHPPALPSVPSTNQEVNTSAIVVSEPLLYLQLWHYAAPAVRDRLTYLLPPPILRRANTGGSALSGLSQFLPLHVQPFDQFVQTHPGFQVYGPPSWMTTHLLASHVILTTKHIDDDATLWQAAVPSTPAPLDPDTAESDRKHP
jgi:hypothetical protein